MADGAINRDTVLAALAQHIGAERGVSARELVAEIVGAMCFATAADERRLRKVIEELRRDGAPVCAHPDRGYFMARTAAELDETCLFLYDRAITTLTLISRMRHVADPDLRGQLRLPT